MFDIGATEMLLIGVIGLIVLGPERLPVLARNVGLWFSKIKRTFSGVKREIETELLLAEMRQQTEQSQKEFVRKLQKLNEDIMAKNSIGSSLVEIQDSKANTDLELRTVAKIDSKTP
jgi:Tat protein translocase TatB subunit